MPRGRIKVKRVRKGLYQVWRDGNTYDCEDTGAGKSRWQIRLADTDLVMGEEATLWECKFTIVGGFRRAR